MKVYVDSSVVVRRLLKEPGALLDWSDWEVAVISGLADLELFRVVDRLRVLRTVTDDELARLWDLLRGLTAGFQRVPISRAVLQRAATPFPTVIGALDSIHLATALLWTEDNDETLTFLTHDRQLALAAQACGFAVKS